MRLKRLLASLVLVFCSASCLWAQNSTPIFPIGEIRPGLKGVGRTIFEGDKIEEFQVEILGVLKNALAPKRDVIVARLSGGPLEKTGVIAGMSGSPIYVDGRLVGAVALSFPFAKEPLAGITPIEEMLEVVPEKSSTTAHWSPSDNFRIARASGESGDLGRLVPNEAASPTLVGLPQTPEPAGTSLASLLLPLRFGGFSTEAIDLFTPQLRRLGFEPMQGGVLSGSEQNATPSKTDLEPGSMISLLLVRGDLNLNVDCTVTYRQGNNLYACGHRVLSAGPAQFPFAPSRVIATVPSLASSFKLDAPGPVAGTIQQDRFSAIYGLIGGKIPPMIPIHLHVDSTLNRKTDYSFEMVQEPFLSPLLLNLAVTSALTVTERAVGASTLELKGKIQLAGGQSVDLEDVLSGDIGTANMVAATVAMPLTFLMSSGFPDLQIQDIDLNIVSLNEKRTATIEQVWSTKSEVRPGDHLELTALLRLPWGETLTQKIPVDIPDSVTDKMLSVVVGDGSSINALQFRITPLGATPRDLQQLVRALNRMRRNDRVYALVMAPQRSFVMQGDEYPSPPPSLLQTFLADPAVSSSVVFSGTSVVGDFETKPSPYTIRGQKMLILKVAGPGT
ncbi:MAG: SpoIVB peptidase S55 domain-containing protein [Terriglobia bacterium]